MVKKFIGYFLVGLVTILPIAILTWLIVYVVNFCNTYLSLSSVLVGVLIMIVGLVPLGYMMTSLVGKRAWNSMESQFLKIPLFGQIYKALKDITKSFVGTENKFTEPVIADLHGGSLFKIGFVTNKDVVGLIGNHDFGQDKSTAMCLVYFPMSFSLAGDVFLVPQDKLKPILDKDAKDIMQTMISGGIISQDSIDKSIKIIGE